MFIQPPDAGPPELYPKSTTTYFLKVANVQVSFCPDGDGTTAKLVWHQGTHHISAARVDDRPVTAEQLAEYEGQYYSGELDVTYGVYVNQDRLCLRAPRVPDLCQRNFRDPHGEDTLRPGSRDHFTRSCGTIGFFRDASGAVAGFSICGGPDLTDLKFNKR